MREGIMKGGREGGREVMIRRDRVTRKEGVREGGMKEGRDRKRKGERKEERKEEKSE